MEINPKTAARINSPAQAVSGCLIKSVKESQIHLYCCPFYVSSLLQLGHGSQQKSQGLLILSSWLHCISPSPQGGSVSHVWRWRHQPSPYDSHKWVFLKSGPVWVTYFASMGGSVAEIATPETFWELVLFRSVRWGFFGMKLQRHALAMNIVLIWMHILAIWIPVLELDRWTGNAY